VRSAAEQRGDGVKAADDLLGHALGWAGLACLKSRRGVRGEWLIPPGSLTPRAS
jgi:hypothetical protein